jgi:hypothetical protein
MQAAVAENELWALQESRSIDSERERVVVGSSEAIEGCALRLLRESADERGGVSCK